MRSAINFPPPGPDDDDDDLPTPEEQNNEWDPPMEPAQVKDQFPDDYRDPGEDE